MGFRRNGDRGRLSLGAVVGDWRSGPGHGNPPATASSQLTITGRGHNPADFLPLADRSSTGQRAQSFFALAEEASRQGQPSSPDYYYQAALCAWQCLLGDAPDSLPPEAALRLYHASVAGLIGEAERCGRFDPRGQLIIYQPDATLAVPFACLGLPWQPGEIGTVKVANLPDKTKLTQYYACPGFGVPVVAVRQAGRCARLEEPYLPQQVPFAATVVLRPADSSDATAAVLEFYDPLSVGSVDVRGQTLAMARDLRRRSTIASGPAIAATCSASWIPVWRSGETACGSCSPISRARFP